MTGPAPSTGTVPVGPMLSMFDPIHVAATIRPSRLHPPDL